MAITKLSQEEYDALSTEQREEYDKKARAQELAEQAALPYRWNQRLSDVDVAVEVPEGTRGRDLVVEIKRKKIKVGLKGKEPIMEVCSSLLKVTNRTYPALSHCECFSFSSLTSLPTRRENSARKSRKKTAPGPSVNCFSCPLFFYSPRILIVLLSLPVHLLSLSSRGQQARRDPLGESQQERMVASRPHQGPKDRYHKDRPRKFQVERLGWRD